MGSEPSQHIESELYFIYRKGGRQNYPMQILKPLWLLASCLGLLASCAQTPENTNDNALGKGYPSQWSQDQIDAYEQCLQDSMAQATAWEVIEQQCREQVSSRVHGTAATGRVNAC